ncbi:NRPS/PKS (OzmH), partial [Streptomyces coelicoflavus ZG0656]
VTPAAARRTELPTYPFARKRYWIPEPPARTALAQPAGPDDAAAEQLPDFYRPLWVRDDAPAPGPAPRPGRVVALVTEASAWLAEAISARIPESRPEQVRIDELPPSAWLERTDGADLVLHLGGVGTGIAEGLGADLAAEQLRTGTLSLFHLVRSTGAARVVVVTSDVHPVAGGTVANPFAAGMHGLLQVVTRERPELRVAGLDFASADLTDEDA